MDIRSAHILTAHMRTGDATSQHTFDLVRVLRRHGVQTRIFHNHPNGALPEDIAPLTTLAGYAGYNPNADLTIVQYPVWFALAERIRDVPGAAIFWYHGVTPPGLWGTDSGLEILEISQVRTEMAWHAHLAVAASPFTAAELHDLSHYPQDRIRVNPLMVDVEHFGRPPDAAQVAALRARWEVTGKRVLLYVGRIAGNKRIDLLVQALAHLRPTHPELQVLVVGDDEESDAAREQKCRLQALAREVGVAAQVTFTGRVPEVKPYLDLADLLVLASQHEGFGVPVVEAMAAGIPVVASASGALPWVMDASSNETVEGAPDAAGLLFEPGDATDLARQVARLLEDPGLREGLVRRGRARAQAFTPAAFEQNVLRRIDEAVTLSTQGPPPAASERRFPLYAYTDVALRSYTVRSGAPLVGRLIEWVRRNSTTHVKEAYLDQIVERQVNYNKMLATEVERLQAEVHRLRTEVEHLRSKSAGPPP